LKSEKLKPDYTAPTQLAFTQRQYLEVQKSSLLILMEAPQYDWMY